MADTDAVTFWWFERRSALALARRILVAVLTRRFVRLEAIPYTNDRGAALRFRVVTTGMAASESRMADRVTVTTTDINESWPCPPICPGGGG